MRGHEMSMVTVTRVHTVAEADALSSHLQREGIPAFVPDQYVATTYPMHGAGLGIRVQVDESDVSRAREILKEELPPEQLALFECPECGSDAVCYEAVSKRFIYLTVLLLGLPLLWLKQEYLCEDCGHKWKKPRRQASQHSRQS